ncbi:PAS/PAC sensor hybrid histidine kinase [Desulfobulbus propionicus DSM 2032]|uniref:histidine kinase n=1 Tax=Desulfobulbus propionicus (strain ATCC 33891 / DSM 2032 / VKM B-1956 / 1pr3) TaxID=577650 RepID=A0A7U3YKE4_DESPD|nr:ATP-binding protein [Desulfobulbus propionicus]ADW17015.1 PAS/PAC sensor hybrid histidine kinase [Desulfobulbus propionicus DSM 2032]
MSHRTDEHDQWDHLKDAIVGLGERSIRKSYYPELKAKIKDLDQQRVFFQSILNSIPDGVVVMDPSGKIRQANPALCRMFGYSNEELAGLDPSVLYENNCAIFRHDDFPTTWCRRFVRKDGRVFLGETLNSEIRDDQGGLLGTLELIRDVSERLKVIRQQRQLEEQLRQSQKMAAIGTLAGGIAHDFNNLLAAILGYAELALLKLPPGGALQREIRQILKAGGKASELVNQILAFSRKETTKRIPIQPGVLIKEVIKLLRGTIPSTITIRERIAATDRMILANPTQLHQVVMNLCTNAFHAMEEQGGEMTLSLESVRKLLREKEEEREWIRISVADNGCGIEPATLERIFEPYFTTKPSGKGTGMGLAVVHGIVESHGGRIEVKSTVGQGTTVQVYFPVVAGVEAQRPCKEEQSLVGGDESILVVDDEQMVADYLKGFLEQLGYRITICNDGSSALALFEHNPQAFDLVITDQTMPGKTGFEMARNMLALRPDLPIILCSGYSSALSPERVAKAGIREFMMKPVSLHDLAPVIRAVLPNRPS